MEARQGLGLTPTSRSLTQAVRQFAQTDHIFDSHRFSADLTHVNSFIKIQIELLVYKSKHYRLNGSVLTTT